MCVVLPMSSTEKPIFSAEKHHVHIKHALHNQSSSLFIEAIRWLSYYDCYNSAPLCVYVVSAWRRLYDAQCSQATYSSSIHTVGCLLDKSVLPKGSCVEMYYYNSCRTWWLVCLLANQNREVETIEFTSRPPMRELVCFVMISLPLRFSMEGYNQGLCLCSIQELIGCSLIAPHAHASQINHSFTL